MRGGEEKRKKLAGFQTGRTEGKKIGCFFFFNVFWLFYFLAEPTAGGHDAFSARRIKRPAELWPGHAGPLGAGKTRRGRASGAGR